MKRFEIHSGWKDGIATLFVVFVLLALLIPPIRSVCTRRLYIDIRDDNREKCRRFIEEHEISPERFPVFFRYSTRAGSLDVCRYFVEELHTPLTDPKLPFSTCSTENEEVFFYLLTGGLQCDPEAEDKESKTLLHLAAIAGNVGICKFLLENGADPNRKDGEGKPPGDYAIQIENEEIRDEMRKIFPLDPRGENPLQSP